MSAQALIRQSQASGVALRLVGGKVKPSGPREAVARLLVPLREHRAALADALQAEAVDALPDEDSSSPEGSEDSPPGKRESLESSATVQAANELVTAQEQFFHYRGPANLTN